MGHYFVEPGVVRLDIGDGDWIEIKRELTYGEQQELAGLALRLDKTTLTDGAAPSLAMDWAAHALAKLATWIVDWSFTDKDGQPVKVTAESVRRLRPSLAERCSEAIDKHSADTETQKN